MFLYVSGGKNRKNGGRQILHCTVYNAPRCFLCYRTESAVWLYILLVPMVTRSVCVIILLYSTDPCMTIVCLLTLVCRRMRLLSQLKKCTPEAGRDSVFCSRALQQDERLSSLRHKPEPSSWWKMSLITWPPVALPPYILTGVLLCMLTYGLAVLSCSSVKSKRVTRFVRYSVKCYDIRNQSKMPVKDAVWG